MTAAWSVNRRAAAAVARHADQAFPEDPSIALDYLRELLEMLGLTDETGHPLPDDNAVYAFTDPGAGPGAKSPNPVNPLSECRRPAGMTTPAGLATLTPIAEQPVSKPKPVRVRKPAKEPRRAKCGTYSGYSRHRRLKEAACDPCIKAAQAYRKSYMSEYRRDGREVKRASHAVCGTTGGWSRHNRLGERPCRGCMDAKNAYNRDRKRAKRLAEGKQPALPRAVSAKCGTRSGYEKHRRLHTTICVPCRDANSKRSEVERLMAAGVNPMTAGFLGEKASA